MDEPPREDDALTVDEDIDAWARSGKSETLTSGYRRGPMLFVVVVVVVVVLLLLQLGFTAVGPGEPGG